MSHHPAPRSRRTALELVRRWWELTLFAHSPR